MVSVRYGSAIKLPLPVHPLKGIFFLFIIILAGDGWCGGGGWGMSSRTLTSSRWLSSVKFMSLCRSGMKSGEHM